MKNLYLVLLVCALFAGCTKSAVKITSATIYPAPTKTGSGHIDWKLDSGTVVHNMLGFGVCQLQIDTSNEICYITINSGFVSAGGKQFAVALTNSDQNGLSYPLKEDAVFAIEAGSYNCLFENPPGNQNPYNEFVLGGSSGSLTVTYFDPVRHIISGNFVFNTFGLPGQAGYQVRDGWFDLHYGYQSY